jgi:hypothetical protein
LCSGQAKPDQTAVLQQAQQQIAMQVSRFSFGFEKTLVGVRKSRVFSWVSGKAGTYFQRKNNFYF